MAQLLITLDETDKAHHQISNKQRVSPITASDSKVTEFCRPSLNHALNVKNQSRSPDTIWYLAYGSNLAAETFQGRRNIHPISAVNVVVPTLRLSFDLPGVPYSEPCFANSAKREQPPATTGFDRASNVLWKNTDPTERPPPYHKDRWRKGMVGVAYELTSSDFAHVIATEGGGASYQDVIVDCYVMPNGTDKVPENPDTEPLKVHTLFAPPKDSSGHEGRLTRPDPSYAQPSARYLKLLTDGAAQHGLPIEYCAYLAQIRPYCITSQRQRVGRFIFLSIWRPVITTLFQLFGTFNDKDGKAPVWLALLASSVFSAVWISYDDFFKRMFGDGERTEEEMKDGAFIDSRLQKRFDGEGSENRSPLEMV